MYTKMGGAKKTYEYAIEMGKEVINYFPYGV